VASSDAIHPIRSSDRLPGGSFTDVNPVALFAGANGVICLPESPMRNITTVTAVKNKGKIGFYWVRSAALPALLCLCMVLTCIPTAALAEGVGRVLRPITRSVADQRRINQASRVSLRVVRPKLNIVQGKAAGLVTGLSMNADRSLLFVTLRDGSARLWDLDRGVQLGGVIGRNILAGAIGGGGHQSEAVGVQRDGSVIAIRPDGSIRQLGMAAGSFGRGASPVLSGAGETIVFLAADGWRVARAGQDHALTNAARAFQPILSKDGRRIVYVTDRGAVVARDFAQGGRDGVVGLGGCRRKVAVTAGAFLPDGNRVMLGDRRGNLCLWRFPERQGEAGQLLGRKRAQRGPLRAVSVSSDGEVVATRDNSGTVRIWSTKIPIRRVAIFELKAGASGPLVLDSRRKWLFAGESNGTVGIYGYSRNTSGRIAGLISTNDGGWTVLNREGRFDGPQSGVDALLWADETTAQTLPIDAFSESYFEPGLLAKLDDDVPRFLNEQLRNMSEEGYLVPPALSIEAIDNRPVGAQGRSRVRVRLQDTDYPPDAVSAVRLYHNGKLVPGTAEGPEDQIWEYVVRMLPGENTFRALGVGPNGVEGPPATATTTVAVADPRRPRMQVIAVGINDYRHPLTELFSARNDAEAIVSALYDRGKDQFDDVIATTLLDSLASASAIEQSIARGIRPQVMPEDILIVYFAGHGYAIEEESGWEWYLLPYTDGWNTPTATKQMIRHHGISSQRLMAALTETEARRVFLILDSCRSGAVIEAIATPEGRALDDAVGQKALRRLARVGGIHILAASRADEDAAELNSVPHGALTYLILEGMEGAADNNKDGTISVQEIIGYAAEEMPLLSRRLRQESISQKPVGYSRGADFVLAGL